MISYLKSAFGPNLQRNLAGLTARVAQPASAVAQRICGRAPCSGAKSDLIATDST
jgi:hypothetical protein